MFQRGQYMDRNEGDDRPIDDVVEGKQQVVSGFRHQAERRVVDTIAGAGPVRRGRGALPPCAGGL